MRFPSHICDAGFSDRAWLHTIGRSGQRLNRAFSLARGRQELFRDGLADWKARQVLDPKPLSVWIALEKDSFTRLRNRNIKAAKVQSKRLHVCVQLFVKFGAFARDMVKALNVETTILIGKPAWAWLNAAGKNLVANAGNPQLVTFFHKLLKLRWQVTNLVAEFLKLRAGNPPGENPKLPRLPINILRHVQRSQAFDCQIAADIVGEAERGVGVVRHDCSRRSETESVGNL